jgi:aminoglycoside N3'-acetyltransferase
MIQSLFDQAGIPEGRALLVHARLRGLHHRTGLPYDVLADQVLNGLLSCKPSLLLIPVFTIYSFIAIRIFNLAYARSETGRFSEEMRQRSFPRTPDPMYSVLDVLGKLPPGLNYRQTFGPGTVFDYFEQLDGIIVNIDMQAFYATPVHGIELEHDVPYRFNMVFDGHIQEKDEPWTEISYAAYVRKISRHGTGSYPPYNQQRRLVYLRGQGVLTESRTKGGNLAWAPISAFRSAISAALSKDKNFLVDQPCRAAAT